MQAGWGLLWYLVSMLLKAGTGWHPDCTLSLECASDFLTCDSMLLHCRRTYTQTQLPGAPVLQDIPSPAAFDTATQKGRGVAEHKLVRTDR